MMPKLILAPMAGFTDAPFRLLCRHYGADYAVTEMVSAVALVRKDKKTALLARLAEGDSPVAVQIFGHDADIMAEAAYRLAVGDFVGCDYAAKPTAIDVNMGCPVKKIVTTGDGSALMKNPELCGRIVEKAKKALEDTGVKLTVKIRAGFSKDEINAVDVAKSCADAGVDEIAVHARTRDELYMPGIRPDVIKAVREAVPKNVAVIGNGDITCADDAEKMLRETGCDGLMIGRAALGDPWIFNEIKAGFSGNEYTRPDDNTRLDTALGLVRAIVSEKGEDVGIRESRGRAAHFLKGMRGSAEARARLNAAKTLSEFENIIEELR